MIIRKCLANGINHFDTAEMYGNGLAEESLGKILKKIGVDRETFTIGTKVHTANDS
jgi:aryl-alcohol dehydrogenase-like predicted oxidoreductase